MEIVGLICEYNPFHNGHVYHINKIKKLYPDSLLVLVMSGYFTERGEVSLISKYNRTKIALEYGVDIVIELPCLYTVNSADIFAEESVKRLAALGVTKLVFGSESNDINKLTDIAKMQINNKAFNEEVKKELDKGVNYPTALSKACGVTLDSNDLLGVSYIKAIISGNYNIEPIAIKRTNSFRDVHDDSSIVSALNIREKIKEGTAINKFIPDYDYNFINKVDYQKMFELLKYKIIVDNNLDEYLGVDEGLSNKLKKEVCLSVDMDNLIKRIKSKRYTYVRLQRMLVHILLGIRKEDIKLVYDKIRILGFSNKGQKYIKCIMSDNLSFKNINRVYELEIRAAYMYQVITRDQTAKFETINKPIKKGDL